MKKVVIFSLVILLVSLTVVSFFCIDPVRAYAEENGGPVITVGAQEDGAEADEKGGSSMTKRIFEMCLGVAGIIALGVLFTVLILRKKPVDQSAPQNVQDDQGGSI